jgi:hypothetical protein
MVENTIADVQKLEQSVDGKSLPDLQIRLALRCCLKELRMLTANQAEHRSFADTGPVITLTLHPPRKTYPAFD